MWNLVGLNYMHKCLISCGIFNQIIKHFFINYKIYLVLGKKLFLNQRELYWNEKEERG